MRTTNLNEAADQKESSATDLTSVTRTIESSKGRITANYSLLKSRTPSDCLFIAHGVKGSMNSSLVSYFHSALAARGFLAVKFNFPYAEGRMRLLLKPDKKPDLVECYRRVVEDAWNSEWKPRSLFLGGISLGAAVASHVVVDGPNVPEVKGLFFLSYPLHRPGSPDLRGDNHLHKIMKPMLFISGTKDVYAEPSALKTLLSSLGDRAQAYMVENGDHAFNKHMGKPIYIRTLRAIVERLAEWVNSEGDSKKQPQTGIPVRRSQHLISGGHRESRETADA
jgi:uncharacterized protein